MRIGAIQKTTLLDYPGKLACTVFLPGCNLRCPFCHNAGLVLPEQIQTAVITCEELLTFLSKRVDKLDGVCISGGEPTIYPDLPELITSIRKMGFSVKLDTNGTNPQMLKFLLCNNLLDYVAMDIKNSPDRYMQTCGGVDVFHSVKDSAALLMSGTTEYEFRTTVCKPFHNEEAMQAIGQWLHGAKQYFLQSFVDSGNLVGLGAAPFTKAEMLALQQAVRKYIPSTQIRGI